MARLELTPFPRQFYIKMKTLTDKQKKEFDKFLNEQMRIFKGHSERLGLRIVNKMTELFGENLKQEGGE